MGCQGITESGELGCGLSDLLEIPVKIYNWLLGLAALVALAFLLIGAGRMTYWGYMEDSSAQLEAAKYTVRRTLAGFAIILLAYVIVNTLIILLGGGGIEAILTRMLSF